MLQVNPATILLLLAALLGAAWAAGLVRTGYDEGRLRVFLWRGRGRLTFDLRDTWLLLTFALLLGWAVSAAVEHSAWVPDSDGRLVPALAFAIGVAWVLVAGGISRPAFLLSSLFVLVAGLALFTPSPLMTGMSAGAWRKWLDDLPGNTNLQLLMGLLLMCLVTGLWTAWWVFKRRHGLVALLPTGTILAVEIINDTNPSLVFFTLVWLAAGAALLLRLNFVALKERWRRRRLPHASDTSWTFGEIGVEATVAIVAIAFLLPPVTSADISGFLVPGVVHPDLAHPFGIGAGGSGGGGGIGTIGYSDLVQPGSQLNARSQTVMEVSGDTPAYSPYWRGVALAGWDGRRWYPIPSTQAVPVRQQPFVSSGETIPRDDLPTDPQRAQVLHDTFKVLVPLDQKGTIFSGGEATSIKGEPVSVKGIMTSIPAPPGSAAALVNVRGDQAPIASFDSIDLVQLARQVQTPYSYTVTETVIDASVDELQHAGTDYPDWVQPYVSLYYDNHVAAGYSTARDQEIGALAQQIVNAAHATTPYDQAKAIESWFLDKTRFSYTLKPPRAPAGVRPIDYFIFTSRKGFCQDFSTAMNVMLRTLGIPSRQMSGFGLGTYDEKTRQYSVNSLDAHSWVEVYFPGYGWIPFEPTPDGSNTPVNRPQTKDQLNVPLPAPTTGRTRVPPGLQEPNGGSGGGATATGPFSDLWRPLAVAGGVLLLLALVGLLLAARWLLAVKDLPRIWKRLLFLGDRLKVDRQSGDTPEEFGARLARSVPALDPELRRLARLYTRSSFRRGGLSKDELAEARRAWARVRGSYAGLVARAWADALRSGKVVSAGEAAASESRVPSPPR